MPAWWSYLRSHPWQRRLLTGSVMLVLGSVTALVALPHVRDYLLLRDLAGADPRTRAEAVSRAVRMAGRSPRTLRRLNEALDDAGDAQFAAIVSALRRLGKFATPSRSPLHVDRVWALELASNPSAAMREQFLGEMLLAGRGNRHVRRGLATAAGDEAAEVRALSAALAARLGDDPTLAALLEDEDPNVAAAAALDAGIARRRTHAGRLREMARAAGDLERRSAAACALARIDPNAAAATLAEMLADADRAGDEALRDRMLHVVCECGGPAAGEGVLGVLRRARAAGRHPPATVLAAVGRLGLDAAAPDVRRALADAVRPGSGLAVRQVLAALQAAEALDLPVRRETEAICRQLWTFRPGFRLLLVRGARLLGEQAHRPQGDPNAGSATAQCIRTLRQAAVYDYQPATAPAGSRAELRKSPLPSAAAAVALWRLGTPVSEEYLRNSAGEPVTLPGDHIAWHLGLRGEPRAFELALTFLPPADAPPGEREYNDDVRSTGAMLLAISARGGARRAAGAERVRSRLVGGDRGPEDDFHVRGAYECALVVLGDRPRLRRVAELLETGQFSQRRAITALTLAGSLDGLDWLLWNPQIDAEDALFLLVDEEIGEVLATCLPALPRVDAAAGDDLARWQLRILRHAYAIGRPRLRPQFPPPPARQPTRPAR